MVRIWCTRSLGRLNFLNLQMDILLLVDTAIEGASPSHARQE